MAKVYISDVIDAPIEHVWAIARDYNGHGDWHPIIAESSIEDGRPSDQVGCVRVFSIVGGGRLREQLLAFSDREHSFTYSILEAPLPVENYVATFRLTEVTEGDRTFVEWFAEFEVSAENEEAVRQQVGRNTFADGISAIARRVASRSGS